MNGHASHGPAVLRSYSVLTAGLLAAAMLFMLATSALPPLGGGSIAQARAARSLVPRTVPPKPRHARIPGGYARNRIDLKFKEGTRVRLRGNRFRSTRARLAALRAALDRYPGARAERLFSRPESVLAREKARIERKSGRQQGDKNLYYRLVLRPGADTVALLEELNSLRVVEIAYPEALPAPPPVTPDFTGLQGYLRPATEGVDAAYAHTVPGGTGSRVKVVDIEYSWNQDHEDLTKARDALIPNGSPDDPFNDPHHGTGVIGELVADDNSFGVTGIVPDAELGLVNSAIVNPSGGQALLAVASAIDVAQGALSAGDVILIEQQMVGANGSCGVDQVGCVAVEWEPANYDAIVSAVSKGINVVETAGNGKQDLDAPEYGNPFPAGRPDSGAIINGAGASGATAGCDQMFGIQPDRGRLDFSNYGARVNLQGWGECVTTTGDGGLQKGPDPNLWYTDDFAGTSSAGPIAAGVVAAVSSVAQQRGTPLSPRQIRSLLVATGTPQDLSGLPGQIGPLPDLQRALQFTPETIPDKQTPVERDSDAPGVSDFSLSRRRFRVGRAPTALAARRRPARRGTAFGFTLSEKAQVTLVLERARRGVRARGGGCVSGRRASRRVARGKLRSRCTLHRPVATLRRSGVHGRNRLPFSGRIGRRALRRGLFRATLVARDPTGNSSTPLRLGFRIVKR